MAEEGWTRLAEYATQWEADIAAGTLRGAGVPVQVQSGVTGLFGPGFSGPTQHGVALLVPHAHLAEARLLLDIPPP